MPRYKEAVFDDWNSSDVTVSTDSFEHIFIDDLDEKNFNAYRQKSGNVEEPPLWPSGLKNSEKDYNKNLYQRLYHIGPISAIIIILIIGLTTTVIHVSWWPITNFKGSLNFFLFLTWNYLVFSNMIQAAFFGGGYVPFGWLPPTEEHRSHLQYCHRCNGYKAPRSHHCNKCNRCVLKMDHHCPWINNCVGHKNQNFFIRFLFFAIMGCSHAVFILGSCLWTIIKQIYFNNSFSDEKIELAINSIYVFFAAVLALSLSLGVITAVSFLLYVQLKIVWQNKTGIEEYICLKAKHRNGDNEFIYPYNLDWKRNIEEVFCGYNGFPKGNGIWWPIRVGCTQFSFSEEQLEQKKAKQEYLRRHANDVVEEIGECKRILYKIINFFK